MKIPYQKFKPSQGIFCPIFVCLFNPLVHGLFIPLLHGRGLIWPTLIFRPRIANFCQISRKAIHWTHTFNLSPSKVISDCIQVHNGCPKKIDRCSLKCRHGHKNDPIELKFEMYTQNLLLFDICCVFWKIAKNGIFRFWGSSLIDPHDPL